MSSEVPVPGPLIWPFLRGYSAEPPSAAVIGLAYVGGGGGGAYMYW
jgi:hypothetical protein